MTDPARKKGPMRILILALTRMGDLYEMYPMVAALRETYPDSQISLVAYREFCPVLGPLSLLTSVYPVDGPSLLALSRSPGSPLEAYRTIRNWLQEIDEFDADLLINLTPNRIGAVLGYLIRAREKRGLHMTPDGYRAHYGPFVPYLGMLVKNRLYNNLNLVDLFLKIACLKPPVSLPLSILPESRSNIRKKGEKEGVGPDDIRIAFATGASQELKRWPVERFLETILVLLESDSRTHAILLGSGEEDRKRNGKIFGGISALRPDLSVRLHDWTGQTGPDDLFALLEQSDLLVSNDTGTMHAAALAGLPVVCLSFANLFYPETGPWGDGNIILYSRAPCAPCAPDSRCLHPVCREDLDPRTVAAVVRKRLEFPRTLETPDREALRLFLETLLPVGKTGIALSKREVTGEVRYRPLGEDRESPEEFYRNVYEKLWREDLEGDLEGDLEKPLEGLCPEGGDISQVLDFSDRLLHLAKKGQEVVQRIAVCLDSGRSPVPENLLSSIDGVDRQVEEISWSCPPLGPLCLFFQLEKESIDVWNPREIFHLVKRTEKTYEDLRKRVERFSRIVREGRRALPGETDRAEEPGMSRFSGFEMRERIGQ